MRRTQSKQSPSYYKHMKVTASPAPSWLQGDNLETQSPAVDLQPALKLRSGGFRGQMLPCGLQDPEILKKQSMLKRFRGKAVGGGQHFHTGSHVPLSAGR